MEHLIGWLLFAGIGIALGMLGGGGAIHTVPILVMVFGKSPVEATAYSLLVVGITALAGAARYVQSGMVDLEAVLLFGSPSLIAVWLSRKWLVPSLPDPMLSLNGFALGKASFLMLLFSLFMLLASIKEVSIRP